MNSNSNPYYIVLRSPEALIEDAKKGFENLVLTFCWQKCFPLPASKIKIRLLQASKQMYRSTIFERCTKTWTEICHFPPKWHI